MPNAGMTRAFRLWMVAPVVIACVLLVAGPASAGKTEQVSVEGKDGYSFFLYVPDSYSDDNPAGVHMFFNGQGGCANNGSFGQWSKTCDTHNLIGINMQYADGDNAKDTGGKIDAAVTALRHVIGKYKIIPGRGMVGSFSGGGLPHGGLQKKLGGRADNWPFCHTSLYSSNFRLTLRGGTGRMSWLVAVGSDEWGMARLGDSQGDRAADLFTSAARGGSADVYFRVTKGKGHSITGGDVQAADDAFERSDLAFCGFLYAPDYSEPELKAIVAPANRLDLGRAAGLAKKLQEGKDTPAELKAKAAAIAGKIDKRVEQVLAMAGKLAKSDPALCGFYARGFQKQLRDHPREGELRELLTEARKGEKYSSTVKAWERFVRTFAKGRRQAFFPSGSKCQLNPEAVKFMKQIQDDCVEGGLMHKMASEFLAMAGGDEKDDESGPKPGNAIESSNGPTTVPPRRIFDPPRRIGVHPPRREVGMRRSGKSRGE